MDGALDPDDGGDMRRPFRFRDRALGFEHGDGSGFVAVAPFGVDRLHVRQRLGGGADGLDLLAKVRVVVLELDY